MDSSFLFWERGGSGQGRARFRGERGLVGVYEDDFAILDGGDGDGSCCDRHTVPGVGALAIDLNRTSGWNHVGIAAITNLIGQAFTSL